MTTIIKYIKELSNELNSLYDPSESLAISRLYVFEKLNIFGNDKFLRKQETLSFELVEKLDKNRNRLLNGEPVQYILGYTWFYDLKFIVNRDVLIPRQETEVLVDTIIKEHHKTNNIKVLDIGTGTGCIPISIKANLPITEISSIDISKEAIEIAKQNALLNSTQITFVVFDILSKQAFPINGKFDIIISNPPYVLESEKELMHKNVLENEPNGALYVSDSDPLIFYRKILDYARFLLNKEGKVYFEINETLGKEMIDLCRIYGFSDTKIIKDLNNKDRFIVTYY